MLSEAWIQAVSAVTRESEHKHVAPLAQPMWQMWPWILEDINLRHCWSLELSRGSCLGSVGALWTRMRCGLKTGFHLRLSARTDIPFVLFAQIKCMRGFVWYIILRYTEQNQFVLKICSHVGENITSKGCKRDTGSGELSYFKNYMLFCVCIVTFDLKW